MKQTIPLGLTILLPQVTAFFTFSRVTSHSRKNFCAARQISESLSFDFSSTKAWENFYQDHKEDLEWHSSIDMESLAELVPAASTNVVLVGTGSSRLPEWIQRQRPNCRLVLQDSSASCLDLLRGRYKDSMSYVRGDATQLSRTLDESQQPVDVIFDKGLMDAIFCNEGWNKPIALLIHESSKVLNDKGVYIFVSYRLPRSTKDFLIDVASECNLDWTFDVKGSNDRVAISIASKLDPPLLSP
jgi:hypothetical protein